MFKTALIDADIIPYEYGNMKMLDEEGNRTDEVLPFEIVRKMVDDRIQGILEATGAEQYELYLTDSKSNFRVAAATILPYKGNRPSTKPPLWEQLREHLIENYDAKVVRGMEADDMLGIRQHQIANEYAEKYTADLDNPESWSCSVICSRDKDLHMIEGHHYVWPAGKQKEQHFYQSRTDGIRFFYKQLLVGDRSTDNIAGIYGIGNKARVVQALDEIEDEVDMFKHVRKVYMDYFGSYYRLFMLETGTLLYILTDEDTAEWEYMFEHHEAQVSYEENQESIS